MTGSVRDEVDEIVAAWRRERHDLIAAPLHVMSRVSRLADRLAEIRAVVFERHGLALWEFDVLSTLRRTGLPYALSPTELTRLTHVTSGTMTNRITRLVARRLVCRAADPSDGRAAIVSLTQAGQEAVDAAMVDLMAAQQRLLAVLPGSDQADLSRLLRILMLAVDDVAETTGVGSGTTHPER